MSKSNLILITGDDPIAVKTNAGKIADSLKHDLNDDFAFEVINGDDENSSISKALENFIISINTPSFFATSKTVWLKHFSGFKNFTTQKDVQELFKNITESLESSLTDNSLTVLIDGPFLDKRVAFFKFCKSKGTVYEHNKIKTNDKSYQVNVRNKIIELCRTENIEIDNQAIEFLSEAVGSDTGRLTTEISKLAAYISSDNSSRINLSHCKEICTKSVEMANWIFAESLADKDIKQSFYSLNILIESLIAENKSGSTPESTMFYSAVRKFQDILRTKKAAGELNISGIPSYNVFQNKLSQNSATNTYLSGMHPYRAYMIYKQSENFNPKKLPGIFKALLNANKEFVSGNSNPRIILENLIFKICS